MRNTELNATSCVALITIIFALCTACDTRGPRNDAKDASTAGAANAANAAHHTDVTEAQRLIPSTAGLDRVNDVARDPSHVDVPSNANVAAMVLRGRDIMRDTRKHAGPYVGNDLSCANCHLNIGQKDAAWPLVGVATLFPEYRARGGRLITLQDRIRSCFMRSMNGTAPPFDSDELIALSAYITWLSAGLPAGVEPAWRGRDTIAKANLMAIDKLDVAAGRVAFEKTCVACHGADGQGVNLGTAQPGPLWGPHSWNDGAGAARVYTLAGFIRRAMPLTAPGSLSDADAQNIAAYIDSQSRPSFARKDSDYKDGKIPVDAVYYTSKYKVNPLRK